MALSKMPGQPAQLSGVDSVENRAFRTQPFIAIPAATKGCTAAKVVKFFKRPPVAPQSNEVMFAHISRLIPSERRRRVIPRR